MLAASRVRVAAHTADDVNRTIQEAIDRRIAYFREHPGEIPHRLVQLDREWDVERALATSSSCLSLLGLALAISGRRRWLYVPAGVQAFYLQHALQGWCPPLPVFRRLGFRTPAEIERERCALKGMNSYPPGGPLMTWRGAAVSGSILAHGWLARAASACPVCVSDTGLQLRAMLASDPFWHFAATIAPIPVLIAAVAGARFATPWLLQQAGVSDPVTRREPV